MKLTQKSPFIGIALTLLALNLVACEDPSDKVTSAKVNDPKTAKPSGKKINGTILDFTQDHGSIEFTGSKVTGKHDGGFKKFQGRIGFVEEKPEKSSFSVNIDMDTTFSDSERLTGHLKSADFFDTKTHKESRFESTEIKKDGDQYQVTGNFKLHGVIKSITFPATLAVTKEKVELNSEFSVNRKDFGIVYKGKADDLIRDGVVIRLKFNVKR
jgi:polyisoprenoid-binding protein YceI